LELAVEGRESEYAYHSSLLGDATMTNERKPDKATPPTDKQDEKITDLPSQSQTDKDALVKGGRMKLDPPKA